MSDLACAKCGHPRQEHSYNGACYGLCAEFVPPPKPIEGDLILHDQKGDAVDTRYSIQTPEGGILFLFNECGITAREVFETFKAGRALSLQDRGNGPLAEFARWALRDGSFSGHDLDGGSVQDKAEALGLIVKTKYDPAIHGDCDCCEAGDDWFVFAPLLAEDAISEGKK